MNVVQDRADRLILAHLELRDGLDGLDPARRVRRHLGGLGVVLVDASHGFRQRALHRGETREVLLHAAADALELALDHSLFRLSARREQHLAVARVQPFLTGGRGLRRETQNLGERLADGRDHVVRGAAREIQDRDREHGEQQRRERGIRSNREQFSQCHGVSL